MKEGIVPTPRRSATQLLEQPQKEKLARKGGKAKVAEESF